MRAFRFALAIVACSLSPFVASRSSALAAATAPNVVISNTASATYQDGNGTSYTTNSNTVATTVQNAPSLTIAPPPSQNVASGQIVVDTYTLTNTGNAAGNFSIPTGSPATVGSNGTFVGYVIAGTSCTTAAPCSLAAAQSALAGLTATPVAGTLTIGVEYSVVTNPTGTLTVPTTLTATITQPAAGSAPAATSASVTATVTDVIAPQARLDLQKSVTDPTSATADIAFTIVGNNGGAFAATDLASVKQLLGAPASGVLVTDLIPQFGGVPLALDTAPAAAPSVALNGASAGTTATLYYSTSASGAQGSWSTSYVAGDYYIGVLLSGGSGGVELPSKPGGSTGAGSVTAATAQITLKFATFQPSGAGSANAGSIKNIANSVIGGNPGATGITPIIGPFAGSGEADSANPPTSITGALLNTTSSSSTSPPGGASNTVVSQAFASNSVLNGPLNFPGTVGYDPAASNNATAASNNLDFTALGFVCANGAAINNGTFQCTIPTSGLTLPGTYQNTGNSADTLAIAVTAPPNLTAQIYTATGCASSITTLSATGCSKGTALTGVSTSGGTVSGTLGSIASQATGNYLVVYLPAVPGTTAVAPFVALDSTVTVSGSQGSSATSDKNDTHFDLYPGGAIQLTKSQAVVTNCPSGSTGQTANAPCPGGTLTYTLAYANLAPAASFAGGTYAGTEPAFATNAMTTAGSGAGLFTITEDGTGADPNAPGNNWATYTNGLSAAPSTSGSTTFTFVYAPTVGTAAGSSKFTATAGGAIAPGASGSVVFSAIVK